METRSSNTLGTRFLLLRELRFLDLLATRFSVFSGMLIAFTTGVGSSGGASGHGVCFAGTVTSNGGSIIHLNVSDSMESGNNKRENMGRNDQFLW